MPFDSELRRVLDQALAELTAVARADTERAREEGLEAGRAQGWEDGREQGRFEGEEAARQEADARLAALHDEAAARLSTDTDALDRLLDSFRALDGARSLRDTLDTVAECAGREAARAAVLLVRDSNVRGWRFIGFDESFDAASFEMDLSKMGVVADAVAAGAAAASRDLPAFAQPGGGFSFAYSLAVAGTAVAVLYADGFDDHARSAGIERRLEALGRHASRSLEAITALKAARALVDPDPAQRAPAGAADADDAEGSAKRYAKLLISEIKLYHEPDVVAGRRDRDLTARLGGEIARARVLYEQRVPQWVRARTDYFNEEVVRTLANGDPTLLQIT